MSVVSLSSEDEECFIQGIESEDYINEEGHQVYLVSDQVQNNEDMVEQIIHNLKPSSLSTMAFEYNSAQAVLEKDPLCIEKLKNEENNQFNLGDKLMTFTEIPFQQEVKQEVFVQTLKDIYHNNVQVHPSNQCNNSSILVDNVDRIKYSSLQINVELSSCSSIKNTHKDNKKPQQHQTKTKIQVLAESLAEALQKDNVSINPSETILNENSEVTTSPCEDCDEIRPKTINQIYPTRKRPGRKKYFLRDLQPSNQKYKQKRSLRKKPNIDYSENSNEETPINTSNSVPSLFLVEQELSKKINSKPEKKKPGRNKGWRKYPQLITNDLGQQKNRQSLSNICCLKNATLEKMKRGRKKSWNKLSEACSSDFGRKVTSEISCSDRLEHTELKLCHEDNVNTNIPENYVYSNNRVTSEKKIRDKKQKTVSLSSTYDVEESDIISKKVSGRPDSDISSLELSESTGEEFSKCTSKTKINPEKRNLKQSAQKLMEIHKKKKNAHQQCNILNPSRSSINEIKSKIPHKVNKLKSKRTCKVNPDIKCRKYHRKKYTNTSNYKVINYDKEPNKESNDPCKNKNKKQTAPEDGNGSTNKLFKKQKLKKGLSLSIKCCIQNIINSTKNSKNQFRHKVKKIHAEPRRSIQEKLKNIEDNTYIGTPCSVVLSHITNLAKKTPETSSLNQHVTSSQTSNEQNNQAEIIVNGDQDIQQIHTPPQNIHENQCYNATCALLTQTDNYTMSTSKHSIKETVASEPLKTDLILKSSGMGNSISRQQQEEHMLNVNAIRKMSKVGINETTYKFFERESNKSKEATTMQYMNSKNPLINLPRTGFSNFDSYHKSRLKASFTDCYNIVFDEETECLCTRMGDITLLMAEESRNYNSRLMAATKITYEPLRATEVSSAVQHYNKQFTHYSTSFIRMFYEMHSKIFNNRVYAEQYKAMFVAWFLKLFLRVVSITPKYLDCLFEIRRTTIALLSEELLRFPVAYMVLKCNEIEFEEDCWLVLEFMHDIFFVNNFLTSLENMTVINYLRTIGPGNENRSNSGESPPLLSNVEQGEKQEQPRDKALGINSNSINDTILPMLQPLNLSKQESRVACENQDIQAPTKYIRDVLNHKYKSKTQEATCFKKGMDGESVKHFPTNSLCHKCTCNPGVHVEEQIIEKEKKICNLPTKRLLPDTDIYPNKRKITNMYLDSRQQRPDQFFEGNCINMTQNPLLNNRISGELGIHNNNGESTINRHF